MLTSVAVRDCCSRRMRETVNTVLVCDLLASVLYCRPRSSRACTVSSIEEGGVGLRPDGVGAEGGRERSQRLSRLRAVPPHPRFSRGRGIVC